jgi:hypothetical protein
MSIYRFVQIVIWQNGGFLRVLQISSTNKSDQRDITEYCW